MNATIKLNPKQLEAMKMFAMDYYTPSTNEAIEAPYFNAVNLHHSATIKSLVSKGLIARNGRGSAYWLTDEGKAWAYEGLVANGYYEPTVEVEPTVAEVVSEVEAEMVSPEGKVFKAVAKSEGNAYVVKTSMREVKFSKKTMKATAGKFAGWRLALTKPKVEATQPPTAKTQRVNPDFFEAYQKAVSEFEAANEVYHKAEAEWLKTGQWPDDKRDAGKIRESALDAKKVASDNYYNN